MQLFISMTLTMIVITDPPGNLPIFLALTRTMTKRNQKRIAWQSALIGVGLLLSFALFGKYVFQFLGISKAALQISGGLLLLLVSLQLLTGQEEEPGEAGSGVNPAIVPLATPLLAGPGAIVAVMLGMEQTGGELSGVLAVVLAVLISGVVQWITFFFGVQISRVIGEGGLSLLTRISGMLLAAIAVQLMAEGVLFFLQTGLK